jgi:hypothetical protein
MVSIPLLDNVSVARLRPVCNAEAYRPGRDAAAVVRFMHIEM